MSSWCFLSWFACVFDGVFLKMLRLFLLCRVVLSKKVPILERTVRYLSMPSPSSIASAEVSFDE